MNVATKEFTSYCKLHLSHVLVHRNGHLHPIPNGPQQRLRELAARPVRPEEQSISDLRQSVMSVRADAQCCHWGDVRLDEFWENINWKVHSF